MGRPSEAQLKQIIARVRRGATVAAAVTSAGVDPAAFDDWLHRPRSHSARERVARALAQADLNDMSAITNAKDALGVTKAKARLELRQRSEQERRLHRLGALTSDRGGSAGRA